MSSKRLTCLMSLFAGLMLTAAPASAQEWWNPTRWFTPQRAYVAQPVYRTCPNGNCTPVTTGYPPGYVVNRPVVPVTSGTAACPGGNCAGKCRGNCTTGKCTNGNCGATAAPYRPASSNYPVSSNLKLVPTSGNSRTRPSPFYE